MDSLDKLGCGFLARYPLPIALECFAWQLESYGLSRGRYLLLEVITSLFHCSVKHHTSSSKED